VLACGGGPAGEPGPYQMQRGDVLRPPAAWQSREDGGARLLERPLPSTPLSLTNLAVTAAVLIVDAAHYFFKLNPTPAMSSEGHCTTSESLTCACS
jgi:hypothetical protein